MLIFLELIIVRLRTPQPDLVDVKKGPAPQRGQSIAHSCACSSVQFAQKCQSYSHMINTQGLFPVLRKLPSIFSLTPVTAGLSAPGEI